jgi:hypothetical protein
MPSAVEHHAPIDAPIPSDPNPPPTLWPIRNRDLPATPVPWDVAVLIPAGDVLAAPLVFRECFHWHGPMATRTDCEQQYERRGRY